MSESSEVKTEKTNRPKGKDIVEKNLVSKEDVASDLLNVFIFDGEQKADPSKISIRNAVSSFLSGGQWHAQERDVLVDWNDVSITILTAGFENQTLKDDLMPLRIIAYDGAEYKRQYQEIKEGKIEFPHPVITFVLYYGTDESWDGIISLKDLMNKDEIPKPILDVMSDYQVWIINVPKLKRNTIELFKSDFWFLADYLNQIKENKTYIPPKKKVTHMTDTLYALYEISKDDNFLKAMKEESGGDTMESRIVPWMTKETYEHLKQAEAEGEARGEARGEVKGEAKLAKRLITAKSYLKKNGRFQDIEKLIDDEQFRMQIFKEAGID